ncbi:hypothetical protein E8E11_000391 [Didymella keratinophila]|nr:hypothetical protein E8E11_000391 [Didymella keratinophila]
MDHQVQGLVLVNNEWVSRPLDVYQIMARAQQDDTDMTDPVVKPASHLHVPGYGILSRTVLPSPLYKFVLPANIRHKDLNDVVLVGEDSVQLHEIHDYGRLRHVSIKSNFSGRVLTARVFGDPREVRVNRTVGSPLPKRQTTPRAKPSPAHTGGHSLPPEVLVLTLTSRTLMFLWAQDSATGRSIFRQRTVKLPAGSSRYDRLGQYLAVDPKCRALAVAAYEGRFVLYKTKPMEAWRNELRDDTATTPIEDERVVPIEGRIMHMEFLSTAATKDHYHVALLFVVAHQGLTKLTCFDWDCRFDLGTATARTERVSVDLDDQNPSLLIPLKRSPDFLLIFDTHVSLYKDVLSGAPQRTAIPIPNHILLSPRPGDSAYRPQWVQWDRAPRNPDFPKESLYIAREDGRVMYAEQGPAGAVDMDDAGEWPYRIDQAFACVNVDNSESSQSYPDVLMAGAAGNDGLLCKVGAWPMEYSYATQYPAMNQFTYVESMPNWSPLTSLCVSKLHGIREPFERERSALFVSDGVAPHGQISELRHGLRALIDGSFGGMKGCTGLWVLHHGSQTVDLDGKNARQHYAYVAVTLPLETLLLRLIRTQPEGSGAFSGAWEDGVWDVNQLPAEDALLADGITRDQETLSASILTDHFSIQITRDDAQIVTRGSTLTLNDKLRFTSPILLAAVRVGFSFLAIALKDKGRTYLEVIPILEDGKFRKAKTPPTRHELSTDPTCVELLELDGRPHVLVGTLDSKISLFAVSQQHSISVVLQSALDASEAGSSRVLCERAVILKSGNDHVLVCATRDGLLLSCSMNSIKSGSSAAPASNLLRPKGPLIEIEATSWHITRMGSTSATVYPSLSDEATAFVACASDFCKIRLSTSKTPTLHVESIWFAKRRRSDNASTSHHREEAKVVPRKLITGAKPTHAAYLTLPRKMLVATTEAKKASASFESYRTIHSTLNLLSLHDEKPLDEAEVKEEIGAELINRLVVAQYALHNAERVYSIADWAYEDDRGKKYNLVIVGTGVGSGSGKETGRRLIFNLGQRGSRLSLQKESTYPNPVYCVALFDRRATVSVVGNQMNFDEWFNRGVRELPSPGIHITVLGTNVYVSTLQHSHLCFQVTRAFEDSRVNFEQIFTDSRERSCTHHLVLGNNELGKDTAFREGSLVLFTDKKTATVNGLYSSGEVAMKNAATSVFEACLPRTVIRLQRGDIRPPWRRPSRFTTSSESTEGVVMDDVVGACTDGTIYAFSILSAPARHLLRLLQNLVEIRQARDPSNQFTIVRHRSGDIFDVLMNGTGGVQGSAIRARDVDPRLNERGPAGARNSHVDGDILLRFFEEDGDVVKLFTRDVELDVPALFKELAAELFPQGSHHVRNGSKGAADIVDAVREWLDEVLMPLL